MAFDNFFHTPFARFDPEVLQYCRWRGETNELVPWLYTNWIEETTSWKDSVYLHTGLSGAMPDLRVKGPDAEKLMSETFVNNFKLEKFPVGKCKHCIALSKRGYITMHGIALRVAEDEFRTYSLEPMIPMQIASGKYNVEQYVPEYNKDFVYQMAGPKALELVENVLKEDIHDLKFMAHKRAKVLGHDVRVLRMGMGGTLAYEIHGKQEDALEIYDEIVRVGANYGLKRLGKLSYMCNHTENGFPQLGVHFMSDWSDPDLIDYMTGDYNSDEESGSVVDVQTAHDALHGSMKALGEEAYFANPIEVGWGNMVAWDHDFNGKEALEKIAADKNTRKICTLEWNSEDIMQIYAAYYDDDKDIPDPMAFPKEYYFEDLGNLQDQVLNKDGNMIGRSSGYIYSRYYKKSISQCNIDPAYCNEGEEVYILWGTTGTRQFKIRAKVARYPYLDLQSNKNFDMNSIPRYKA